MEADVPDQVDRAIHNQRQPIKMLNIGVVLASTGRQCALQIPADMSIGELLEFLSWAPVAVSNELTKQRASKIVPVTTMPTMGKLR